MILPYNIEDYAQNHDEEYIFSYNTIGHVQYELTLIDKVLAVKNSWCDVGCGTGHHLKHAGLNGVVKCGIDRAEAMLNVARSANSNSTFIQQDLLELNVDTTYDLVTNFWYGYIHQNTIQDVQKFFLKMVELTSTDGDIIIAVCNPYYQFTDDNYRKIVYNKIMTIDAIIWSAKWQNKPYEYMYNIAPHPLLILDWLSPYFKGYDRLFYKDPANNITRQLIHLKEKI